MSSTALFDTTVSGKKLTFFDDSTVSDGGPTPGTWRTDSPQRENALRYSLAGAPEQSLPLTYAMNAANQLVVSITGLPNVTAVSPITLQGRIVVEENRNFSYYLVKDDGFDVPTDLAFYVYGDVAIDAAKNVLSVIGDRANVVVAGESAADAHSLNISQGDNATDLLEFLAVTRNPLAAGGSVDANSTISLQGNWDLFEKQLTFVMNYESSSGTPKFYVGVAGKLKGIAAGFQLFSDGANPRLLLTVAGKIAGTNKQGQWDLVLGFAQKKLTASLSLSAATKNQGSNLAIKGKLDLKTIDGGGYSLDLELQTTWRFDNGQFNLSVEGSNGKYSLALSGELKIKNWDVSFEIAYSPTSPKKLSISVGLANPGSQLHSKLELYFDGNQKKLKASLSLKLNFVNGFLLP